MCSARYARSNKKAGRVLTKEGRRDLDRIASSLASDPKFAIKRLIWLTCRSRSNNDVSDVTDHTPPLPRVLNAPTLN